MDGEMDECMDEGMDEWMDGWMGDCILYHFILVEDYTNKKHVVRSTNSISEGI